MIDGDDVLTIAPEVVALAKKIGAAFESDSPGGKRLTRAERKEIAADAWALAGLVLRSLL